MAKAMRTDDAIFTALQTRLAPQMAIGVELVPAKGARGLSIAKEAEGQFGPEGIATSPDTMADIHDCLVVHGVAFATLTKTPREDGSRTDVKVNFWPIEFVRWDATLRCYMTRVDRTPTDPFSYRFDEVPIEHGNGEWIIISANEHEPYAKAATILASSMIWARHAYGVLDWAKASRQHGNAKIVGEMPDGIGTGSADGLAALELVKACASPDTVWGLKPKGMSLEYVNNTSSNWQVFAELILNAQKAAARVHLGTDGVLGSQGGAPGVDIQTLMGVATTKIQGDLATITRCLQTGAVEVWTALNFDDSSLAPVRRYMIPDADSDAARKSLHERTIAFHDALDRAEKRFVVDEKYVEALAKAYGVESPLLKPAPEPEAATTPAVAPAPGLRLAPSA